MNINDFIMNIREKYQNSDQQSRLEKNYREEFQLYSSSKLEKIFDAVITHHGKSKPPELGEIFKAMSFDGISRTKHQGNAYAECLACNTTFPLKSSLCPRCNKNLEDGINLKTEIRVHISDNYPDRFFFVRELCAACPVFRKNSYRPKGIGCKGFQDPNVNPSTLGCDKCPCRLCCEDVRSKNPNTKKGFLMKFIKENAEMKNDNYWITFYQKKEIKLNSTISYAGKRYQNKTGKYLGASPRSDNTNWLLL